MGCDVDQLKVILIDRAKKGDAESAHKLGGLFRDERNNFEAANYYKIAAKLGHIEASVTLAEAYIDGRGVIKNFEKAIELLSEAASKGSELARQRLCQLSVEEENADLIASRSNTTQECSRSLLNVSKNYGQNRGGSKRQDLGLRTKAKLGDFESQYRLGLSIYGHANSSRSEEGVRLIESAAESGFKDAYDWLYKKTEADETVAATTTIKWPRSAITEILKFVEAEPNYKYLAGVLYELGIGVRKDISKAVAWYEKAEPDGVGKAAGKVQYIREAIKSTLRIQNAAELGYPSSQFSVAFKHIQGDGTQIDINKGLFWLRRSAEKGFLEAQCLLGDIQRYSEEVLSVRVHSAGNNNLAAFLSLTIEFGHENAIRILADAGYQKYKYELAGLYSEGVISEREPGESKLLTESFYSSAECKDRIDFANLLYCKGSYEEAYCMLYEAAVNGHQDAEVMLCATKFSDLLESDLRIALLRKWAYLNNTQAQVEFASSLLSSEYSYRSAVAANYWLDRSVMLNSRHAKYLRGLNFIEGIGCIKDQAIGIKLIRTAAEDGEPLAIIYLTSKITRFSPIVSLDSNCQKESVTSPSESEIKEMLETAKRLEYSRNVNSGELTKALEIYNKVAKVWPLTVESDVLRIKNKLDLLRKTKESAVASNSRFERPPESIPRPDKTLSSSWLGLSDRIVFFDFETTGLDPRNGDRVIEVGAIVYKSGVIEERFTSLVNSGAWINGNIYNITGISNEMVAKAPRAEVVMKRLSSLIGDSPLVGHNVNFDKSFLVSEFSRLGLRVPNIFMCTLLLARRIHTGLQSYKLEALANHFGFSSSGRSHRALPDVENTVMLWETIISKLCNEHRLSDLSIDDICTIQGTEKKHLPRVFSRLKVSS